MKKMIIYYAGEWAEKLLTINRINSVDYFIDDSLCKISPTIKILNKKYKVFGSDILKDKIGNNLIVVSDNKRYIQAKERLCSLGYKENVDFYNGWKLNKNYYTEEEKSKNWIEFEKNNQVDYDNNDKWEWRTQQLSLLIPKKAKSIMDLGCGNSRLKKYLNDKIIYYGVDYIKRDETTIVCDLNKQSLPKIDVEVYYMAGLLDYIDNISLLFSQMKNAKYLIFDFYDEANYLRLDGQYTNIKTPVLNNRPKYFTFADLVNALNENGFYIEKANYEFEYSYEYFFRVKRMGE